MDVALLHPSRFIKSQEFKGKDVTYTISAVKLEEMEKDDDTKEMKGIMHFTETNKSLVINRTNSDCFKGMFGRETEKWIGKRVTLYPEPFFNNFTKEHTTATRVRGSPDIGGPLSVVVALPRKKPKTVTMKKTSPGGAPPPLDGDELAAECAAIAVAISECAAPADCDALWVAGLGKRIGALPADEQKAARALFAARKTATKPVASEVPPPA